MKQEKEHQSGFCDTDVLMQGAGGQGKTGVCSLVHSRYPAFSCKFMRNMPVYIPTYLLGIGRAGNHPCEGFACATDRSPSLVSRSMEIHGVHWDEACEPCFPSKEYCECFLWSVSREQDDCVV